MKTKIALLLITAVFYCQIILMQMPPAHVEMFSTEIATPKYGKQDVEEIQSQLRNIGYYDGPINGVYDENTVKSVKDFQSTEAPFC